MWNYGSKPARWKPEVSANIDRKGRSCEKGYLAGFMMPVVSPLNKCHARHARQPEGVPLFARLFRVGDQKMNSAETHPSEVLNDLSTGNNQLLCLCRPGTRSSTSSCLYVIRLSKQEGRVDRLDARSHNFPHPRQNPTFPFPLSMPCCAPCSAQTQLWDWGQAG
ncbi:hypothetical protein BaRGS_00027671 [Batillaria attramentaria]|uniref:Uncharacterized protein n=1 Tax=Batillaria attramentaria TaxID=370345 RepID=A0ABD0K1D7_9CAEN